MTPKHRIVIADWSQALSPQARAHFRCRYDRQLRQYIAPSESIIRDVMVRADPRAVDQALQACNACHGTLDDSLAINGKTMCNAIDDTGRRAHIMSVVGHESAQCYTQKKSVHCR